MNTTQKYILEEKEIELTKFVEKDISTLDIWIESDLEHTKTIAKQYEIGPNGRIMKLRRFDDDWTAYPPINFNDKSISKHTDFRFIETLIWNEWDQLDTVQILDKNTNQVHPRTYMYDANKLIQIEDQSYIKQFIYAYDDRLSEIKTTLKIKVLSGQVFNKILIRNKEGRVTEKITRLLFPSGSKPLEMKEKYVYNDFDQLVTSIQTGEDGGKMNEEMTTFEYISEKSDKISFMRLEENGLFQYKINYNYTRQGVLNSVLTENSKGLMTKTTYIRK